FVVLPGGSRVREVSGGRVCGRRWQHRCPEVIKTGSDQSRSPGSWAADQPWSKPAQIDRASQPVNSSKRRAKEKHRGPCCAVPKTIRDQSFLRRLPHLRTLARLARTPVSRCDANSLRAGAPSDHTGRSATRLRWTCAIRGRSSRGDKCNG